MENEIQDKKALVVLDSAMKINVRDEHEYLIAGEVLKTIKDKIRERTEYFAPIKKKAHEAWKGICAKEREALMPFENAEKSVRDKISDYLTEQERIRREEQQKAEREAAAKAEAERQKLLDRAAKAKSEEKAEELLEKAEAVYQEPVFIEPTIDKTTKLIEGSITTKKDIKIIVTNTHLLLDAIVKRQVPEMVVEIKTQKLKAWAKMLNKTGGDIPGVIIEEISSVMVR